MQIYDKTVYREKINYFISDGVSVQKIIFLPLVINSFLVRLIKAFKSCKQRLAQWSFPLMKYFL